MFSTYLRQSFKKTTTLGDNMNSWASLKPELDNYFGFLTLTMEEDRDIVFKEGFAFNHKKLQASITRDRGANNSSKWKIGTPIVAYNLLQRESHTSIIRAIKQAFGADNIIGISFGNNNHPHTDKQAEWCHIQYLNAAIYTEWLHKFTYIIGKQIDFISHRESIDGTDPKKREICLTHALIQETITNKV